MRMRDEIQHAPTRHDQFVVSQSTIGPFEQFQTGPGLLVIAPRKEIGQRSCHRVVVAVVVVVVIVAKLRVLRM